MALTSALWILVIAAAVSAQDCRDDLNACLTQFRQDLVDNDKYFFGTRYDALNCPAPDPTNPFADTGSWQCQNPDRVRKNLLSRLLKIDDAATLQQIAQTVSLATLKFTTPATKVYACRHEFTFPAINDYFIDPTKDIIVDQSQVGSNLSFTWNKETPTQLYTVIVISLGAYFSHGVYINAISGRQSEWDAVEAYFGPKNGVPQVVPYMFMAIPQPSRLDVATATGVLNGIKFANSFQMNVASFLQQLGFSADATRRMSASLLNMYGDVYGAKEAQAYRGAKFCPYFASQQPELREALSTANIPAAFSTGPRQYLTSLTVDVQPLFSTEDTMFESCCASQDVPRAQLLLDPFSPRTQMPVQLRNTPRVTLSDMEASFGFGRTGTPAPKHTLMLVDFGPPGAAPADPTNPSYIVHWMVTNIQNKDVETGNEVIPYFGSNPFTANQARLYTFLLIEQTQDVNPNRTDLLRYVQNGPCRDFPQRCQYAVSSMLSDWGLATIRGANWYLAEQDAFARMRIYNTWAYKSKKEVCAAVPGFTDPCPLTCQGVALREFNLCNSRRVQHPANHQGCTHG